MELRTQKEIVEYLKKMRENNFLFDMVIDDLLRYLSFDNVKEFMKADYKKESWAECRKEYTKKNVLDEMKEYMSFAIEKAENERGISANRSLMHYQNWFWLIGETEMAEKMFDDYHDYGMPKLKEIQEWLKARG